jgi:hypothetical protein
VFVRNIELGDNEDEDQDNEDLPEPDLLRSSQQRETRNANVPSSHRIVPIVESPGNQSERTQETHDDEIEEPSPAPRKQQEKRRGQTQSQVKPRQPKRHLTLAPVEASTPPTRKRAATGDPDTPSNAQTDVRIFCQHQ